MKCPTGILAAICIAVLQTSVAQAQDHPLLSAYAGSTIESRKVEEFGNYKLVKGRDEKGGFVSEELKGKLTRIVYRNPPDRSTLEIFTNYEKALTGKGMGTKWRCELDECGPAFARSAWGRFNGLFAAADGDPRYLAGRVTGGKTIAYLAVMVGRARTQVDVVEIAAMQGGMVAVDAAGLGAGLDRDGRVSVYGIYFEYQPVQDQAGIQGDARRNRGLAQGSSRTQPLRGRAYRHDRRTRQQPYAVRSPRSRRRERPGKELRHRRRASRGPRCRSARTGCFECRGGRKGQESPCRTGGEEVK